ncbi:MULTISPECIES: alpha/beta fold hydrolase [unclassified Brevibacterium]|uniref:alpha/beta hydrolase n=1 Tax=unclassified Brevibacterium TaxID=2614124 RepID=UPI001E419E32|nr:MULTISPECIES: alpha/beta fold hydrolase [unclassified Brevibacterium]MCD1284821.1 alpha/beta hydrolase [Brevibacterium sp. CCUG 69071]MDK8435558.1 alpha/beta fold hydrolase [Brevibacterium sp. H-BE7]
MEIDFTPQHPVPTAPYRHIVDESSDAVLFLHGITGSPAAWFPIARSLAEQGHSVSVPLLPGHGTQWRDLNATTWSDWLGAALTELGRLEADHDRVIVAGLSMGGALALGLGATSAPPQEIVLVNPALHIDSPLTPVLPVLKHFVSSIPAIGGDIAHPGRDEFAYERTPIAAIASFASALEGLREELWKIEVPVTVFASGQDNVVGPRSLRTLRSGLPRRPQIVAMRRSRHVATLDHDAQAIAEAVAAAAASPRSGSVLDGGGRGIE